MKSSSVLPVSSSTSFPARHKRTLKTAMKVLVVLGIVYGAMACWSGGSQVAAANGPTVSCAAEIRPTASFIMGSQLIGVDARNMEMRCQFLVQSIGSISIFMTV